LFLEYVLVLEKHWLEKEDLSGLFSLFCFEKLEGCHS